MYTHMRTHTHTHTHTHYIHRSHVYIAVSGTCVEWIYVTGAAWSEARQIIQKLLLKDEVSVIGADRST